MTSLDPGAAFTLLEARMDVLVALVLGSVWQADALLMESRQVIGLLAAFLAAMLAAQLGWHGTDRVIARRRGSED